MAYKYITIFLISLFSTYLLIPKIIKIGRRFKYFDSAEERKKNHKKNMVRIGGLGIFIGILLSSLFALFLGWIPEEKIQLFLITQISSCLYFFIGFLDDLFSVSFLKRLFLQILGGVFIWSQGIQISKLDFSALFGNEHIYNLPIFISLFITVLWIVGVTNSFNWLDGLDGLSCGVALISSLSFILLFSSYTNTSEQFLIVAVAGACLGFLYFNIYPAKIFMGDGGSYLLGSNLALFSIYSNQFFIDNSINQLSFVYPLLILFIPLGDMSCVVFSRIFEGKLPFLPDRRHLHYRLIDLGISHRNTVLIFYFFSIIFSSIALFLLP